MATAASGDAFDAAYRKAEEAGLARKTIPARDLYGRMMRTLAQTGNGWMTFKDAANRTANQTTEPGLELIRPHGQRHVGPIQPAGGKSRVLHQRR